MNPAVSARVAPWRTASPSSAPKSIVLQAGVHYLNETIALAASDSGLTLMATPGAEGKVTVSGGVLLAPTWSKSTTGKQSANIWVTEAPELKGVATLRGLTTLGSATREHRRVTRAREPNADPAQGAELCTHCWHGKVVRWHSDLDCIGKAKTVYKDLRNCDNDKKIASGPLAGQPCKNDSAMWNTYNTYSNGHGGCCAAWSGDHSPYGPMGNCVSPRARCISSSPVLTLRSCTQISVETRVQAGGWDTMIREETTRRRASRRSSLSASTSIHRMR